MYAKIAILIVSAGYGLFAFSNAIRESAGMPPVEIPPMFSFISFAVLIALIGLHHFKGD